MSERKAPYLHVVRSVEAPETSAAHPDSEGAQSVETVNEDTEASSVAGRQPAPSDGVETADKNATTAHASDVPLNQPLTQAIMHLAVGWVALCVERAVHAVDIQQVGRRQYEVSVHYADAHGQEAVGEGIILRVTLEVASGLVVHSTIEPVRP